MPTVMLTAFVPAGAVGTVVSLAGPVPGRPAKPAGIVRRIESSIVSLEMT